MLEWLAGIFIFRIAPPTGALGKTLYMRRKPQARQA
jgi:hypothetical protein